MKNILTAALALTVSLGVTTASFAQAKQPNPVKGQPRVLLVTADDTFSGYIVSANKRQILWKETANTTVRRKARLSTTKVYFTEPVEFTEAMELFKSRNYKDARDKFKSCAALYKKVREVPGNFSTLAGFYELECLRKTENLEELMNLAENYDPENLLHQFHKIQYEMYGVFWDAVRQKGWTRLDAIAKDEEWLNKKLPGNLRAQIAYCHGLALEGMKRPVKALNAYNTAFVADFAASENITRKSALNCMRIILDHEDVKTAIRLYPTEDYSDDLNGAFLIKEGTALVKLWDKTLGSGDPLPEKYKAFLKYPPKKK